MAHSTLSLGSRDLMLNDSEILLPAFFMLRHAEAHPKDFPPKQYTWLEEWSELFEPYMAGAITLGLERHLTTPQDIARFGVLAAAARKALAEQPEIVPGAVINQMLDAPDLFDYGDQPRQKLLDDFDRIAAFVAEGL